RRLDGIKLQPARLIARARSERDGQAVERSTVSHPGAERERIARDVEGAIGAGGGGKGRPIEICSEHGFSGEGEGPIAIAADEVSIRGWIPKGGARAGDRDHLAALRPRISIDTGSAE